MAKKDKGGAATANEVYVLDKDFAWVPARLIEQTGEKARVSVPIYSEEAMISSDGGKAAHGWTEKEINLKHYPGKSLPLQNVKNGALNEKEDMVDLPFLHEVSWIDSPELETEKFASKHIFPHEFCASRPQFYTT
jgi:hypothetical protein